ncbi:MAG: T9SS type A sorting domain-containing protein [Candidatus Kapaibacteriota bacterium]
MRFLSTLCLSALAILVCFSTNSARLIAQPTFILEGQALGKLNTKLNSGNPFSLQMLQLCDAPATTSGVVSIRGSVTNLPMPGRLTTMFLSGTHANLFRVVSPTTASVDVPLAGLPLVVHFFSATVGTYSAQIALAFTDSSGKPLQDTLVINLTVRRGKNEFQILESILDFGLLPPNTASTKTFQYLRNTGTEALLWNVPMSIESEFTIITTLPTPMQISTLPGRFIVALQPGETLSLTIRFNGLPMGMLLRRFFPATDWLCRTTLLAEFTAQTQPVSVREPLITAPARSMFNPNPASDNTTLHFSLVETGIVTARLYSTLGIEVFSLAPELYERGTHTVDLKTASLPQGTYFCVLQTPKESSVQRLTIVR